jgi:hypothetical protein
MKKTKRTISILVLMAIFTFSWGASYRPVFANEQPPVGPSDGSAEKKTDGKDTKGGDGSSSSGALIALLIRLLCGV